MSDSRAPALVAAPHRLTLSSPDALLAAIPHLLGFPPRDSVVHVGLGADDAGRESIQLTQRFGRPADEVSGEGLVRLTKTVAAPMRACGSRTRSTSMGPCAGRPAAVGSESIGRDDRCGTGGVGGYSDAGHGAVAIQHWTRGDGARTNASLNRAIADDPG